MFLQILLHVPFYSLNKISEFRKHKYKIKKFILTRGYFFLFCRFLFYNMLFGEIINTKWCNWKKSFYNIFWCLYNFHTPAFGCSVYIVCCRTRQRPQVCFGSWLQLPSGLTDKCPSVVMVSRITHNILIDWLKMFTRCSNNATSAPVRKWAEPVNGHTRTLA